MSEKFKPFFGSFVLESLTVGMYGESRNAIREYLQNAFDAVQQARRLKLISESAGLVRVAIAADRNSLTIRDNGIGVSEKQAPTILTSIGASTKEYKSEAGFRGIGRLAGIGFSNELTFRTRAKGEEFQTVVTYNAKQMRELMKPGKELLLAEELLTRCITVEREPAKGAEPHFFEVKMTGWDDPPIECIDPRALMKFISQVSPVPFDPAFKEGSGLVAAAAAAKIPIEQVRITLRDGELEEQEVTKPYRSELMVNEGKKAAIRVETYSDANWWGWIGFKDVSGTYDDEDVAGVRVRVKNLQIDGTELFRDIFRSKGKGTDDRFQKWFVGEIHTTPGYLVPNARRDGFEENAQWKLVRSQWEGIARELAKDAHRVSKDEQVTLEKLSSEMHVHKTTMMNLRKNGFQDRASVQALSTELSSLRTRINRGKKNADADSLADFVALADMCQDFKNELAGYLEPPPPDCSAQVQEAENRMLLEILSILQGELDPVCYTTARNVLQRYYPT